MRLTSAGRRASGADDRSIPTRLSQLGSIAWSRRGRRRRAVPRDPSARTVTPGWPPPARYGKGENAEGRARSESSIFGAGNDKDERLLRRARMAGRCSIATAVVRELRRAGARGQNALGYIGSFATLGPRSATRSDRAPRRHVVIEPTAAAPTHRHVRSGGLTCRGAFRASDAEKDEPRSANGVNGRGA